MSLDAQADGAFGGKTNRRAGYSKTITFQGKEYTEIEWIIRTAKMDGTLASGEGRKIVEHYERILAALREPSEAVMQAAVLDYSGDLRDAIRAAVAAAEQEIRQK